MWAIAMTEIDEDRLRRDRAAAERARELEEVPLQVTDKSKWPKGVRQIAMTETGGLGIDRDGRLYWNGKPVEIVGRRLDLTAAQFALAIIVALATLFGAAGACVQGWTAYHDWACKVNWPTGVACPHAPTTARSRDH
jgi:hypothetical protein